MELAEDIARRGAVLKPIIVDAEAMLVIDGHHRLNALKLLGARRAPVVLAEADDIEAVTTWAYLLPPSLSRLADRIAKIIEQSASPGSATLSIEYKGVEYTAHGDPVRLHEAASSLIELMEWSARRIPLPMADTGRWLVFKPPVIPHEAVVKLALSGRLLPPKTTCYITRLKNIHTPTPLKTLL